MMPPLDWLTARQESRFSSLVIVVRDPTRAQASATQSY